MKGGVFENLSRLRGLSHSLLWLVLAPLLLVRPPPGVYGVLCWHMPVLFVLVYPPLP